MLVVDIGANTGDLGKDLVTKDIDLNYFAVEPNHIICEASLSKLKRDYPDSINYRLVAVSEQDGEEILYSPLTLNGQVGSLLKINQLGDWQESLRSKLNVENIDDHMIVETISVPSLVREHNITRIDFLKIDTQGTDLQILERFLEICDVRVAAVEIEVTSTSKVSHYIESHNSMVNFFKLINKYGFDVFRMMPASGDCTEFNVFIAKSYEDFLAVNSALDFKSLSIFSRFWTVLGIGNHSGPKKAGVNLSLLKKLVGSIKHPISSYRSLVIKLTS